MATAFSDIKIAHTVFALPFAVLGAFLALGGLGEAHWGRFAGQLGLIVACMFFARTWAMLVNRLADRRFDAANPRTEGRALASGRLGVPQAVMVAAMAGVGFVGCCALFWWVFGNSWPIMLSVPTLGWIALYSFTKRFTWLSHFFLGGALAASPIAAAIAVEPEALSHMPALWLIAAMVLTWVAGFDVLYALQDIDYDRSAGLHSVPEKFGWRRSLWISRTLHLLSAGLLIGALLIEPRFGAVFSVGIAMVLALLAAEHMVLARRGLAGMPMAFFTINGVVSIALGLLGSVDLVM